MTDFDDYSDCDKQMYKDWEKSCRGKPGVCFWDENGKYRVKWDPGTFKQDQWEKIKREDIVFKWWIEQKKLERQQQSDNARRAWSNS